MRKTWTVTVDEVPHTVELAHGFWSGVRTIVVDGREVHRSRALVDFGSNTAVKLGSQQANVIIATNGVTFHYDLAVDGISQLTGKPISIPQTHRLAPWGWLFVAACALVPVVTVGGAVPGAIGVGGIIAVVNIAGDPTLSVRDRILRCLSATAIAWAAVVLFMFVVRGLAGR